jgi:hypothetical protein
MGSVGFWFEYVLPWIILGLIVCVYFRSRLIVLGISLLIPFAMLCLTALISWMVPSLRSDSSGPLDGLFVGVFVFFPQ